MCQFARHSSPVTPRNNLILEGVLSVTWPAFSLLYFTNVGQAASQLGGKIFGLRWRMHWFTGFSPEPSIQFVGRGGDKPASL